MKKTNRNTIPCQLCGRDMEMRTDKNGKPYFVCQDCFTQYFVRGGSGRERLNTLLAGKRPAAVNAETIGKVKEELDRIADACEVCECGIEIRPPNGGDSQSLDDLVDECTRNIERLLN